MNDDQKQRPTSVEQWLAVGRSVLQQRPFSRLSGTERSAWNGRPCTLEGCRARARGRARARRFGLALRPGLLQQNGFAHGGVVSCLADNALTNAGGAALGGVGVVRSEFKLNDVRPAVGKRLVARASTAASSPTQAVCRCDVFAIKDGAEKLCAVAQGSLVRLAREAA